LGDQSLPPPQVQAPSQGQLPTQVQVTPLPTGASLFNATDRTVLNILRIPSSTPDWWLQMNNHNIQNVRSLESQFSGVVQQLNSITGFISPCALWNRPSLAAPLVTQVPALCVDVQGYGRIQVTTQGVGNAYQAISNVQQNAKYCSNEVELPPSTYQSQLRQIVGAAAFGGPGTVLLKSEASTLVKDGTKSAWVALMVTITVSVWSGWIW